MRVHRFILFLFSFLATSYLLPATKANAEVPDPHVFCNQTANVEFHSLRPYQASTCNSNRAESPIKLYCGNDLIARETYSVLPRDATECIEHDDRSLTCYYYFEDQRVNINVNLDDMELPIAGNTQLDPNSTNPLVDIQNGVTLNVQSRGPEYQLTDPQKVNEYISWYLNGTIYRAEWPFPVDPLSVYNDLARYHQAMMQLTDFSGPLRKLLSWRVQLGRVDEMGSDGRTHRDQRLGLISRVGYENHDQGVACATARTGASGEMTFPPYPCYYGETPGELGDAVEYTRLRYLGENQPPLEEDYFASRFVWYWQNYLGWRGQDCIPVWLFGSWRLFCIRGNPTLPNFPIASYYNYIPFSSTEDVRGEIVYNLSQTPQPVIDGVAVLNASYAPDIADNTAQGVLDPQSDYHVLYYPHLYELAELSALLQEIHLTWEHSGLSGLYTRNEFYDTYRCDLGNARWNSGDDIFGEYQEDYPDVWGTADANGDGRDDWDDEEITGTVEFDVTFTCDFPPVHEPDPVCYPCLTDCQAAGGPPPQSGYELCSDYCSSLIPGADCSYGVREPCRRNAYPAISSYTRMPFIDDIWDRLVAGRQSVYKRFYPRELFDNPGVAEILDLPTVTTAHYSHTSQNPLVVESTTFAGRELGGRPGDRADIYFPHFGGLYEYFLKGIQKALRPQDYATYPTSGTTPTSGTIGQCTTLPASEEINYRNPSVQPRTAQDLYNRVVDRFPGNQLLRTPAQNNEIVPDWVRNQGFNENSTYYDIVVGTSRNAGYNPAFVLTIWLAETGASDYQSFPYGIIDFGCGTSGSTPGAVRLLSNLRCFLDLYYDWSFGGVYDSLVGSCREGGDHPNYEDFLLYFATGICSTIEANNRQFCPPHAGYHTKIWNWYQFVIGVSDTHP